METGPLVAETGLPPGIPQGDPPRGSPQGIPTGDPPQWTPLGTPGGSPRGIPLWDPLVYLQGGFPGVPVVFFRIMFALGPSATPVRLVYEKQKRILVAQDRSLLMLEGKSHTS